MKSNENIIEIKNATVKKGDTLILDGVSLSVKKFEHIALIGPNGSGKSSLLKLFYREFYPLANEETIIKIFGSDQWDVSELKKKISIISDSIKKSISEQITGIELVLSGFFGSFAIYSIHKVTSQMKKKAEDIINFLEIEKLQNKKIEELSSGELNRFLLARALVKSPDLLILDEPTANLDIKASNIFLSYISKIAKKKLSTIIMVTHNIHDLIPEIKRVTLLKQGKIFLDGEKNRVLNSKNLSMLFDYKVTVLKDKKGNYKFY